MHIKGVYTSAAEMLKVGSRASSIQSGTKETQASPNAIGPKERGRSCHGMEVGVYEW